MSVSEADLSQPSRNGSDSEPLGRHLASVRGARYGHPEQNFARTAAIWETITERPYTVQEVGLMMLGVKLARLIETPDDEDSLADIAGYAETLRMLR